MAVALAKAEKHRDVAVGRWRLPGTLTIPDCAAALVVFAHGSGSSRHSARNQRVARDLNSRGMATLLFDLLLPQEEMVENRRRVFDIPLLAGRLTDAVLWTQQVIGLEDLPVGLFGASTGAAAALHTAAVMGEKIGAVVSRGGRPDLAADELEQVVSPTLLIVGGNDLDVLRLNEMALKKLKGISMLKTVPGASHLFPEPGTMDEVTRLAGDWFTTYLTPCVT